jgi:hypothetical protein
VTADEARSLKIDDPVEARYNGSWRRCRFVRFRAERGAFPRLVVRRVGLTANARPYPRVLRLLTEVCLPAPGPALTANVFADWLDEQGEPTAAAKLRKAFPIADGR